jgi:phage terminase large subunit-like protein
LTPKNRSWEGSGRKAGSPTRFGPKAAVSSEPLPLDGLPKAGGARVVAFLERFIVMPKGTGARKHMVVRPWQVDRINDLYDRDPRPRRALWSMPRGQGKSGLASALGLYAIHGDGVHDAIVVVVAADERQAGIVFNTAVRMTELSKPLLDRTQVFRDHLYVPGSGSTFQVLPAEAHRLEGLDPSMTIIDEIGVVNRETYEVVALPTGKRDRSLVLMIGTPSSSREDSVMWDLRTEALATPDPSFVFFEYTAPDLDHPVDCEHCLELANPALDDLLHRDGVVAMLPPAVREATFRRKRLGQWVEDAMHQWMAPELWAACAVDAPGIRADRSGGTGSTSRGAVADVASEQGKAAAPTPGADTMWVLGLDGSATGDVTALVAVSVEDLPHVEVIDYWQPSSEAPVDVLLVEETIRQACRDRQVVSIVADPFRWTRSLQILAGEGLPILEYPQTPGRLSPATNSFYEAVVNKALTHDGNKELALHMAHAIIKADPRGERIVKEHKKSPRRIDLAMASIMAFDRAKELVGKTVTFW